jgi:hypothetical protein
MYQASATGRLRCRETRMPLSGEVVSGRIINIEVTGACEDVRLRLSLSEAVVTGNVDKTHPGISRGS